jgi:hypothetical protein
VDVLVRCIVILGMLAIVPLGLALVGGPGVARVGRWWVPAATCAAVALWLPRGPAAAALAGVYLTATLALAACAPLRLWAPRRTPGSPPGRATEAAVLTALVAPSVAGVALVAERAGEPLFGFELEVLSLTVAHFHLAGFAAALVAGLVCRAVTQSPSGSSPARSSLGARLAAVAVPGGTLVVLLGFFSGAWVEFAGAVVLTGGMWLVAWLTWSQVRARAADRGARVLLGAGAVTLVGSMALALSWAFGEAAGVPHPSVEWMAATHGVANAVAFGACAVLGWRRLRVVPL